jgi:thiol-disulfide isomerase/thioredoxin
MSLRIGGGAWLPAGITLAAALLAGTSGCSSSSATGGEETPPAQAATSKAPAPAVEIMTWDETQKRLESLRGKVVVLDVWSTYCDPCVREFPNLVALQSRFGDKVACVSFNTDFSGDKDEPPESFRKPVLEFLTVKKARMLNVICSQPGEELFDQIKLGGPPAVFVYAQSGKLARRFDNSQVPKKPEFTYKTDVVPLVEKLLADPQ